MNYKIAIAAAVLAFSAIGAQAATAPAKATAAKGVKCGDSYIAAGKTCTKAPPKAMGKGVPCGDSFIAVGQVCHKTATAAPAKPAMTAAAKPAMAKPEARDGGEGQEVRQFLHRRHRHLHQEVGGPCAAPS